MGLIRLAEKDAWVWNCVMHSCSWSATGRVYFSVTITVCDLVHSVFLCTILLHHLSNNNHIFCDD